MDPTTLIAFTVALTIAVYCPDELPGYLSHIDSLDLDDTTK